ncbi:PPOX class F420-dependent oxidoreductase [Saccharomonospora saliphila]|uniref:PPOX class F420-dependent oxidoreductase n=1 Tax=Saccharomonospora saliphila TaxID=369829 RepID=UPI00048F095C|nr:PPOX class F420-dependent oxidoreductase [Saccharomonospora saliphila]
MPFTEAEYEYLTTQTIGRLCTLGPGDQPQCRPIVYFVNRELGTIDIGGYNNSDTQKFRNVRRHPRVSLLVDDLASRDPWVVRGVELRGDAEALLDAPPPAEGFGAGVIRIHPRRILSWGMDPNVYGTQSRNVS